MCACACVCVDACVCVYACERLHENSCLSTLHPFRSQPLLCSQWQHQTWLKPKLTKMDTKLTATDGNVKFCTCESIHPNERTQREANAVRYSRVEAIQKKKEGSGVLRVVKMGVVGVGRQHTCTHTHTHLKILAKSGVDSLWNDTKGRPPWK